MNLVFHISEDGSEKAIRNPEDIHLQRSNYATLTMYIVTVMHPVGKCKLTFTRGNSKHLLQIQVVSCYIKPLIRAETCEKLKFPQVLINDKDAMTEDKMPVNNAP